MKSLLRFALMVCTWRPLLFRSRFLGGRTALDFEFPYHVSIKHNGNHSCSGSIVNEDTILTAANCIYNKKGPLTVGVGSNKLGAGNVHDVAYHIVHDEFNPEQKLNDIALLKLKSKFSYTINIQPVALATQHIPSDVNCVATGWGFTVHSQYSNYLQRIDLKTISMEQCKEAYASKSLLPVVDTNICTKVREGQGTCHGDIGGPIISYGQQIGIMSWNHTCEKDFPEVHTRVSSYLEWIKSKVTNAFEIIIVNRNTCVY